jgi:hypothetical protein
MLASDVPAYAERLAPFLLNFAEHSHKRATALQLLDQIMSEHMQVYVVDDFKAVCLTTVHPEHIEINCCAGEDRTDWQAIGPHRRARVHHRRPRQRGKDHRDEPPRQRPRWFAR